MKKILSMLVAAVLSLNLCATAVFADNSGSDADKLFEMLYGDMLNCSYEGSVSVKNNSSWDFIDEIMKTEESSNNYSYKSALYGPMTQVKNQLVDMLDVKALAESAVDFSGKMKADYNISENYDKIQMYSEFKLNKPISLNEQLAFSIDTMYEMYMDVDFSDLKNPVYKLTIKSPFNKKYIYIDYSEVLNQMLDKFSDLPISEELIYSTIQSYIKNSVNAVKESYKKNSTVTYSESDQTYTMKMNDAGFKNCIFDVFDTVLNSADVIGLMAIEQTDKERTERELNSLKEDIEDFKNVVNKITILGEDGYTATYKVDNDGKLTGFSTLLDISINLYDIACAVNDQGMIDYFAPAGKDKCQIDVEVKEDCNILKLGEVTVNYPALTDENSIDVAKLMKEVLTYYGEDAYGKDTHIAPRVTDFIGSYYGYRVERNGETYIPVRSLAEALYIHDDDITLDENGIVTLTDSGDVILPFKTLAFYENGNSIFIDGAEFWIDNPTFEEDGTTYIPISALKLVNLSVSGIRTTHYYSVDIGKTIVHTSFDMELEN